MKPRTALALLAVAVLLLSVEARRKSSKSSKSGGRGQPSKQVPLRTANSQQQQVQNNAAVKQAVAAMRSGRMKPNGGRSGSAPSPSNLNQPQSASNLNRAQSYPGQQQQQRPLSPTNMQNPQAPQSADGAQNYNQPPPSYQQAVGGQQPMMQPVAYPQGGYPQGGFPQGGYPQGGFPQGGYPGAPMGGAPMGYPMMAPPMQPAAPAPKKGLIPDFLKPQLTIGLVPLAMMAAGPIKSMFSGKDDKENKMRRRFKNENGTIDSNNTMAGPPFMLPPPNGSLPEFPMGLPPPLAEGENATVEGAQPPPPFPFMAPPQQFVDENGTVHQYAPRPFFPLGMYAPQMHHGQNGSAPMMYPPYPFPFPYPPPYPYAFAPQANPFIRNKMPQPEELEQQVPAVIQSVNPEKMVEVPQPIVDLPMAPEKVELKNKNDEEDSKDAAANAEVGAEVTPKTGVVYVKKANEESVPADAVKLEVAAPAAA